MRLELDESRVSQVSGGALTYYDTDNNGEADTVIIDGVGTFNCNGSTKMNIAKLVALYEDKGLNYIVNLAKENGYIW